MGIRKTNSGRILRDAGTEAQLTAIPWLDRFAAASSRDDRVACNIRVPRGPRNKLLRCAYGRLWQLGSPLLRADQVQPRRRWYFFTLGTIRERLMVERPIACLAEQRALPRGVVPPQHDWSQHPCRRGCVNVPRWWRALM